MTYLLFTLLLSSSLRAGTPVPLPVPIARTPSETPVSRGVSSSNSRPIAPGVSLPSALLALSGGIAAAILGGALKYSYDLRIARRKDRLDRINLQLRLLYGPLYASDLAAREAWMAFRRTCRPNVDSFWTDSPSPTEAEAAEWRTWTTEVFMPLNERMERTIVENADLLPGSIMPQALLTMCAHVAAYKAIRKKWSLGDFSEHNSPINYPWREFRARVTQTFQQLKMEQALLVAATVRRKQRMSAVDGA